MRNPHTAHWRDSARMPQFFGLDARSTFPIIIFLLHIRMWTLYLALGICGFFWLINRFGFTLPVFFRYARNFIIGNERSSRSWYPTEK